MTLKIFGYYRSTASYRVRIALNLKRLAPESVPVHLTRNGGEQFSASFRELNPQSLVPFLETPDGAFGQSLAIIEYLEERYPQFPLLPTLPGERAFVRQIAGMVACDMHPLNNLRVLQYLTKTAGFSEQAKQEWIVHWNSLGLEALEKTVQNSGFSARFCLGDAPTLADCCLIPQLFNARRFAVDLQPYPRLLEIEHEALQLDAFIRAAPGAQPDAE